jgi:hypothetical protein
MVNTKMFVFKHPKYYKELRKRNKSDQVISDEAATAATSVHPGPGPSTSLGCRGGPKASSSKLQAPSVKLSNQPEQASSDKRQAPSCKHQVSSHKLQAQ